MDGIAISRLNNRDVVRHKLVKDIIKAFEKYKEKEESKQGLKQRRKADDAEHRKKRWTFQKILDYNRIIREVVDAALEFEECPYEVELNVILTSNEEIAMINRDYRDLFVPTDVLSFPMVDYVAPGIFSSWTVITRKTYFNPETGGTDAW